jgi:hypothetical protein
MSTLERDSVDVDYRAWERSCDSDFERDYEAACHKADLERHEIPSPEAQDRMIAAVKLEQASGILGSLFPRRTLEEAERHRHLLDAALAHIDYRYRKATT